MSAELHRFGDHVGLISVNEVLVLPERVEVVRHEVVDGGGTLAADGDVQRLEARLQGREEELEGRGVLGGHHAGVVVAQHLRSYITARAGS